MVRRQTRAQKRNRRQQNKSRRNNRRQNKSLRRKRKSRRKLRGGWGFRDTHRTQRYGSEPSQAQIEQRERERLEELKEKANRARMSVDNYEQQQREYEYCARLSSQ